MLRAIAMDIGEWLRGVGLDRYERAFRENGIDARSLPYLTSEDLREIGVKPVGHRRHLLQATAALNTEIVPASAVGPKRKAGKPPRLSTGHSFPFGFPCVDECDSEQAVRAGLAVWQFWMMPYTYAAKAWVSAMQCLVPADLIRDGGSKAAPSILEQLQDMRSSHADGDTVSHRIDGLVSEETVMKIGKTHDRLVLGPKAVVTPLAEKKARELNLKVVRQKR